MSLKLLVSVFVFGLGSYATAQSSCSQCEGGRLLATLHESGCIGKFTEAMKGANGVGEVKYTEKVVGKTTIWKWEIPTVNRRPAPDFSEHPRANLIVEWKSTTSDGPQAADKGTEWRKNCRVEAAGKATGGSGPAEAAK